MESLLTFNSLLLRLFVLGRKGICEWKIIGRSATLSVSQSSIVCSCAWIQWFRFCAVNRKREWRKAAVKNFNSLMPNWSKRCIWIYISRTINCKHSTLLSFLTLLYHLLHVCIFVSNETQLHLWFLKRKKWKYSEKSKWYDFFPFNLVTKKIHLCPIWSQWTPLLCLAWKPQWKPILKPKHLPISTIGECIWTICFPNGSDLRAHTHTRIRTLVGKVFFQLLSLNLFVCRLKFKLSHHDTSCPADILRLQCCNCSYSTHTYTHTHIHVLRNNDEIRTWSIISRKPLISAYSDIL